MSFQTWRGVELHILSVGVHAGPRGEIAEGHAGAEGGAERAGGRGVAAGGGGAGRAAAEAAPRAARPPAARRHRLRL